MRILYTIQNVPRLGWHTKLKLLYSEKRKRWLLSVWCFKIQLRVYKVAFEYKQNLRSTAAHALRTRISVCQLQCTWTLGRMQQRPKTFKPTPRLKSHKWPSHQRQFPTSLPTTSPSLHCGTQSNDCEKSLILPLLFFKINIHTDFSSVLNRYAASTRN